MAITPAAFYMLLNLLIIPPSIDYWKNPEVARERLAGLNQSKNKGECAKSLLYLLKIHFKYWAGPCLIMHLLYMCYQHKMKVDEPVCNYLDIGYIAQFAVRNHCNTLLKFYLSLGLNPCFRDVGCMTLFEYAFLYNNPEAGSILAQHNNEVLRRAYISTSQPNEVSKRLNQRSWEIASPIFFIMHAFLEKLVTVNEIDLDDKLQPLRDLTEITQRISLQNYRGGSHYLENKKYNLRYIEKGMFTLELKIFEKICLGGNFSEDDVNFLKKYGLIFEDNGAGVDYNAQYLNEHFLTEIRINRG